MLAWHLTFTAYGFWLPNDPRGSGSDFVGSRELYRAGGKATYLPDRRKSRAHRQHDQAQRRETKESLEFPPVEFSGAQARAIGRGFALAVMEGAYVVFACSILPDHVHVVMARCDRSPKRVIGHLKSRATTRLYDEGIHPFQNCKRQDGSAVSCWAKDGWKVFLFTPDDVRRAIRYVENNPLKEGKPRQRWSFVRPYHP